MKIGIDISALQGPHRMRGIGYALINFIDNIPEAYREQHSFIFYVLPYKNNGLENPTKLLTLKGLDYKIRFFNHAPEQEIKNGTLSIREVLHSLIPKPFDHLIRRFMHIYRSTNVAAIKNLYMGDPRGQDLHDIDIYLQPDQSQPLPRKRHLRKILIIYDIIPYVLDGDYLSSYGMARKRGCSIKKSARLGSSRWLYAKKLHINAGRAQKLLAISQHTKNDFVKFLGIDGNKIAITHLGASKLIHRQKTPPKLRRYTETAWGYIPQVYHMPVNTPFLLYVGGTDRRRKLSDLVTAFNNLRAQGHNLKLVLSGDILQGPGNIPTEESREALLSSSYINDIIFMGFTDDATRDWLYCEALAFVYPSSYEGFGLPILEAMQYGTPVITYKNTSLYEVAGDAAIYANDAMSIMQAVVKLLNDPSLRVRYSKLGKERSAKYSWKTSADNIMKALLSLPE